MMILLARIFRSINSKLSRPRNWFFEKILKIVFAVSVMARRYFRKSALKNNPVIIDNFDSDIRMQVDTSRAMGAAIFWTGYHEFREFQFLHRYLKRDMVFVDVGANQGEYTLFVAKRLPQGRVLAFEPLPLIRRVLEENVRLNHFSNVEIFDYGLSDRDEDLTIHEVESDHEGLATFYLGERKSKASFEVPLKTLDAVFPATGLSRLDFIKLDIEGGELKALNGSYQTIKAYKPVIMIEINDETYRAAGYNTADVKNFFDSLHYRAYRIEKRGRLKICDNLPAFGNIIFSPDENTVSDTLVSR